MSDSNENPEVNAAVAPKKSNSDKKKKNRQKKGNASQNQTPNQNPSKHVHSAEGCASGCSDIPSEVESVKGLVEQLKLNPKFLPIMRSAKTSEEAMNKSYKFWSTQPVPKLDEKVLDNEAIEPNKPISEIRAEPYALPDGFKWETLNLDEPLILTELYTLLNENYVEGN